MATNLPRHRQPTPARPHRTPGVPRCLPRRRHAVHLLSELCANAILHSDSGKTGGTFTVRARHVVNRYLRGEVEDQGSDWHGELTVSATRPHGLYLLLSLTSACSIEQIGRVHRVWFRLDYPRRTRLEDNR